MLFVFINKKNKYICLFVFIFFIFIFFYIFFFLNQNECLKLLYDNLYKNVHPKSNKNAVETREKRKGSVSINPSSKLKTAMFVGSVLYTSNLSITLQVTTLKDVALAFSPNPILG